LGGGVGCVVLWLAVVVECACYGVVAGCGDGGDWGGGGGWGFLCCGGYGVWWWCDVYCGQWGGVGMVLCSQRGMWSHRYCRVNDARVGGGGWVCGVCVVCGTPGVGKDLWS